MVPLVKANAMAMHIMTAVIFFICVVISSELLLFHFLFIGALRACAECVGVPMERTVEVDVEKIVAAPVEKIVEVPAGKIAEVGVETQAEANDKSVNAAADTAAAVADNAAVGMPASAVVTEAVVAAAAGVAAHAAVGAATYPAVTMDINVGVKVAHRKTGCMGVVISIVSTGQCWIAFENGKIEKRWLIAFVKVKCQALEDLYEAWEMQRRAQAESGLRAPSKTSRVKPLEDWTPTELPFEIAPGVARGDAAGELARGEPSQGQGRGNVV